MSKARAQAEISSAEYIGWIAYSNLEMKRAKRRNKGKAKRPMKPAQIGAVLMLQAAAHKAAHPEWYRDVRTD